MLMHYKIFLNLAAFPTLASSILTMILMVNSASASEVILPSTSCGLTPTNLQSSLNHPSAQGILVVSALDSPFLDFSEAESDAAVTLFGCDCPSCINALRQLRRQPLATRGQGHCWSNLQKQVSSQQIKETLQSLENPQRK
jgi:hypothetical protein